MSVPVYFDYNATTPLDEQVLSAMLLYMRREFGNASSRHEYGTAARKAINNAREQVAALIGAPPPAMAWHPVDRAVGNVRNQGAQLVAPVRAVIRDS